MSPPQPTIKAVAKVAGVSAATVSRVINGTAQVQAAKVERVHQAMLQLGYRLPYLSAQKNAQHNKSTIGVLLPSLQEEACATLAHHLQRRLHEMGHQMTCLVGNDDPQLETEALQTFQHQSLGGCVVFPRALSDESLLCQMPTHLPTLLLHRHLPEWNDKSLNFNHEKAGTLATEHLLERGHTRIAHITGPMSSDHTLGRYTGYIKALQQAGLGVDPALVFAGNARTFDVQQGEILTQRLLGTTHFTAIFAYNDWMAVGAIRAIRSRGLRVPEDVSVVGVGNFMVSQFCEPTLTTVHFPVRDLAQAAVDQMIRLLHGSALVPIPLISGHLEARGSSGLVRMVETTPLQT